MSERHRGKHGKAPELGSKTHADRKDVVRTSRLSASEAKEFFDTHKLNLKPFKIPTYPDSKRFHEIAAQFNIEVLSVSGDFLERGQRTTALTVAVIRHGRSDLLSELLLMGVDINAADEDELTPLHHAVAVRARSCLRQLIKHPDCDYLKKDSEGRYASEIAILIARDYAVARLLMRKQILQAQKHGVALWD